MNDDVDAMFGFQHRTERERERERGRVNVYIAHSRRGDDDDVFVGNDKVNVKVS